MPLSTQVLTYFTVAALGAACLATVATSQALHGSSSGPGGRPTGLIAADLMVQETEFIACFEIVTPAGNHAPSGAEQRRNKAVLLPCLQAANPEITNASLDAVMNRYRPEGPMR